MNLNQLSYREVLKEDIWQEYEDGMSLFHLQQLVPLNVNTFLLNKLLNFPFGLISTSLDEYSFFRITADNLYQNSLLIITRTVQDQGGRGKTAYTIKDFKNLLLKHVRDEYRHDFQSLLRQQRFDSSTENLLKRTMNLRTAQLAHIDRDYQNFSIDALDMSELELLRDTLNNLLNALSFNTSYMMLPLEYYPTVISPAGTDKRSDIDWVLHDYAKRSFILNAPENNKPLWNSYKENLTEDQLVIINKLRRDIGLYEVLT